jgi:hypothetical protein
MTTENQFERSEIIEDVATTDAPEGQAGEVTMNLLKVTNVHTNDTLVLGYDKSDDACLIAIHNNVSGRHEHIFLKREDLRELIGQFSDLSETQHAETLKGLN